MLKLIPVYTIRIVYKSGYTHDFEATAFDITDNGYTWEGVDHMNRPILLGASDIAAVYQVGVRRRLTWK